jgi:hypothetical protein
MLRKLVQRLREPSSMAGLAALALLLGQSSEAAAAWAQVAAAGLGVAAVLVGEHGGDREP